MKKLLRITYYIITLGWFPFMFICAAGYRINNPIITMLIVTIGLSVCIAFGIGEINLEKDTQYWLTEKEMKDIIKEHEKAIEELDIVKQKLLTKLEKE